MLSATRDGNKMIVAAATKISIHQAVHPDDGRSSGGHEEQFANDQVAVSRSSRTPPTEGHQEQVRPCERHQQDSADDACTELMMSPGGTERDREIDEPEATAPSPPCRPVLTVVGLPWREPAQLATCGGPQLPPDPCGFPRRTRLDVHRSQGPVVRHQTRAVSLRKARAARAARTTAQAPTGSTPASTTFAHLPMYAPPARASMSASPAR